METRWRKRVLQNVKQLLLLRLLQSMLCTIILKARLISHRHLVEGIWGLGGVNSAQLTGMLCHAPYPIEPPQFGPTLFNRNVTNVTWVCAIVLRFTLPLRWWFDYQSSQLLRNQHTDLHTCAQTSVESRGPADGSLLSAGASALISLATAALYRLVNRI